MSCSLRSGSVMILERRRAIVGRQGDERGGPAEACVQRVSSESGGDCSMPDRCACEGEAGKGSSKRGAVSSVVRGPTTHWGVTGA